MSHVSDSITYPSDEHYYNLIVERADDVGELAVLIRGLAAHLRDSVRAER